MLFSFHMYLFTLNDWVGVIGFTSMYKWTMMTKTIKNSLLNACFYLADRALPSSNNCAERTLERINFIPMVWACCLRSCSSLRAACRISFSVFVLENKCQSNNKFITKFSQYKSYSSITNDFQPGLCLTFHRWHFGINCEGSWVVFKRSFATKVIFLRDHCSRKLAAKFERTICVAVGKKSSILFTGFRDADDYFEYTIKINWTILCCKRIKNYQWGWFLVLDMSIYISSITINNSINLQLKSFFIITRLWTHSLNTWWSLFRIFIEIWCKIVTE